MKLPQPDFLRPRRGIPALAWGFLAVSASVLALTAADAAQAWAARADTRASVDLLRGAASPRAAVARREDAPTAALRALLAAPWQARFEAVEAASAPGLAWLSMDLSQAGELQLVGLAPSDAAALQTAERLRASERWDSIVVTRIEPGPPGSMRFEIRGTPRGAAR